MPDGQAYNVLLRQISEYNSPGPDDSPGRRRTKEEPCFVWMNTSEPDKHVISGRKCLSQMNGPHECSVLPLCDHRLMPWNPRTPLLLLEEFQNFHLLLFCPKVPEGPSEAGASLYYFQNFPQGSSSRRPINV